MFVDVDRDVDLDLDLVLVLVLVLDLDLDLVSRQGGASFRSCPDRPRPAAAAAPLR